jgi:tetratricopeptide (TPR) repeat protein
VFLWFKREALYAPADFPDVKTFKELIQKKFEHLEIKQDAARIDLQTDLSDVYRTVDRLMELEDTPSAIGVGRSFLQDKQFDKSIKIFSHIHEKIRKNDRFRYKLFANIAYAKIGLGQYDDAIGSLLEVKKIEGLEQFAPWHSLALAYAYFKLGNSTEYKRWIDFTRKNGGPDLDIDFFEKLYPEIAKEIRSFTR